MMETITDYYAKDHDRLEDLFQIFQEFKRKDFPKAKEAFAQFLFGLKRHIIWEEDILFPLFEKKTGMFEGGPTAVMRVEHTMIRKELDTIHDKVAEESPESDEAEEKLRSVLSLHNQKEEQILYPAINGDRLAKGRELFLDLGLAHATSHSLDLEFQGLGFAGKKKTVDDPFAKGGGHDEDHAPTCLPSFPK